MTHGDLKGTYARPKLGENSLEKKFEKCIKIKDTNFCLKDALQPSIGHLMG